MDNYSHNRDFSESTDQRGRKRKIRSRTLKKQKKNSYCASYNLVAEFIKPKAIKSLWLWQSGAKKGTCISWIDEQLFLVLILSTLLIAVVWWGWKSTRFGARTPGSQAQCHHLPCSLDLEQVTSPRGRWFHLRNGTLRDSCVNQIT